MSDTFDFGDEDEFHEDTEDGDPAVPGDLLELHLILEEAETSPEDFKEAFG